MNSLQRMLTSLVIIFLAFVGLNALLLFIDNTLVNFLLGNLMVVVDKVLGAWLIVPPFLSWTFTGFIAGTFFYLSVIEGHRFNSHTTRMILLAIPALVLLIAPFVWAHVELRFTPTMTFEETGARVGEEKTVGEYTFVWVPPGRFRMGSPEDEPDRLGDELAHVVTLTQGFWLGKYEVTQRQWQDVMGANPSRFAGCDMCPVENVSQAECLEFIAKLTEMLDRQLRLPTEAEWEYAARAGTKSAWASGDNPQELDEVAWHAANSEQKTHPIGEKQPNPWGLHDMHGNVREWCADWYGPYSAERQIDPVSPATGELFVVRGGGWASSAADCRSARRQTYQEGYFQPKDDIGFRLVLTDVLPPPTEEEIAAQQKAAEEQEASEKAERRGNIFEHLHEMNKEKNKRVNDAAEGIFVEPSRPTSIP